MVSGREPVLERKKGKRGETAFIICPLFQSEEKKKIKEKRGVKRPRGRKKKKKKEKDYGDVLGIFTSTFGGKKRREGVKERAGEKERS